MKGLKYFLIQSQVLALYRQFTKVINRIPNLGMREETRI